MKSDKECSEHRGLWKKKEKERKIKKKKEKKRRKKHPYDGLNVRLITYTMLF